MRPIVSYDDITLPYEDPTPVAGSPPAKKRKNNDAKAHPVHPKDDEDSVVDLTHEEIWDDSALIDAWNSAQAEYAAFHGGDKDSWKNQPVKKSTLWYNTAPESSKSQVASSHPGEDSNPIDFDTFVPSHDASLHLPAASGVPGPDYSAFLPEPQGPMVSQDEAFRRALGAMYWGGYWTAMYHCQRSAASQAEDEMAEVVDELAEGMDEDGEEEEEELLSTQR